MAVFTIKVKTRTGVRTAELQARTERDARRSAEKMGRVLSIRKTKGDFGFQKALTPADRQTFFIRVGAMLRSKVGTSEALTLIRDTFHGQIQETASRMLTHVEAGADFAEAIEQVGAPDFPDATVALLKAGSRSGETWRAVQDAAKFEYELANVKKGATKGMASSIAGFVVAGVTTLVSTIYVGPKIIDSPLMQSAAKNGANMDIGWITTSGYVLGGVMGFLMVIGISMWLLAAVGRQIAPVRADKLILKVPYYKDLVLSRNNFIVLYGLALLVRSGVRIEEALRLSAEGAPKGALRTDLVSAMNAVKTGKPWPRVMDTLHPTDKAALMSSQDREQIAITLDTLATQYRELYAARLGSFVPIVQLVTALFISLSGGVLFGQSILPMLMAAQGLTG